MSPLTSDERLSWWRRWLCGANGNHYAIQKMVHVGGGIWRCTACGHVEDWR